MAKSRKGFAKQNGRKKARLARKDTKAKKILKTRKDVKIKLTQQQLAQVQQEAKNDVPSDNEASNDDNEWTELGSCTTGGGLKLTPNERKLRTRTRKQIENKQKKTARGEAYTQRFNHQVRQQLLKKTKLRRARREEG
eukprot:TRINITY_DN816_c1_g1_i1.p2 TRINITY_DN816_c1_g1~~TRINITY_DN816_c1_g1_i1.p2  ORF type:complete len:138 (+),score=22.58 TRINITY_DN816_c1_g1_i1:260-673(+)